METKFVEKCRVCINEYCDGHKDQVANIRSRLKNLTTDFIIEIDQQRFPVHKLILAMHSACLAKLVFYGEKVPRDTKTKLHFMTATEFTIIIDWMYSGEITLRCGNVIGLYAAARVYDIPKLITLCLQFMVANPGCSMISAWEYTEEEKAHFTKEDGFKLISILLPDAVETSEFQHIPKAMLLDILSSPFLSVDSENIILWAILRWVSEDLTNRHEFLPEMVDIVEYDRLKGSTASDVMNNCNVRVEESMLPLFTEAMLLLQAADIEKQEVQYVEERFEEEVTEQLTDVSETPSEEEQDQSPQEVSSSEQLHSRSKLVNQQDQKSQELNQLYSLEQLDVKPKLIDHQEHHQEQSIPNLSSSEQSVTESKLILDQQHQSPQELSSSEHSVAETKPQLPKRKRKSSESSSCFSCFKSCCGHQRNESQQLLDKSHHGSDYYMPAVISTTAEVEIPPAEPTTAHVEPTSPASSLQSSLDEAQTPEESKTLAELDRESLQGEPGDITPSYQFLQPSKLETEEALQGEPDDRTPPSDQSLQSSETELPMPAIGESLAMEMDVQRTEAEEEEPVEKIQLGTKPLTAQEVTPVSDEQMYGPSSPAESQDGGSLINVVTRAYCEDATAVTRNIIPKMAAGSEAVLLEVDIKCPACNDGNDGILMTMQVTVNTPMLRAKDQQPRHD